MNTLPQRPEARRVTHRQTITAALAVGAIALTGPVLLPTASAQSTTAATSSNAAMSPRPFDAPTAAEKASPRKVFAHYVPSLPISLDNEDPRSDYYQHGYIDPNGEGGKHKAYGGFVRDRPLGRPVRKGDWRAADMRTDVNNARAAGLDGFSLDIFTFPQDSSAQQAQNVQRLLDAAAAVDPNFKIMLMPDMTAGLGKKDVNGLAKGIATLGKNSAAYRLKDGRLVVSPFHAETHDASWWKQFVGVMANTYKMPVALMPLFLNESSHVKEFAPFSYGMANWGNRNPGGNDTKSTSKGSPSARIKAVHDAGLMWMQPVSVQDERPRSGAFQEAQNTQNLRSTWQLAIKNHAEFVQLTTWNDFVEGSSFSPSVQHGTSLLDMSAYYMAIYKTGSAPKIKRDVLYLSHRIHQPDAKPSFPQTKMMKNVGTSPARSKVEVLSFLTSPGTVVVTVGSHTTTCNVPAGPSVCLAPLTAGRVSAAAVRSKKTVAQARSPFAITDKPYVQDLGYVFAVGRPTGQAASAPQHSPKPAAAPKPPKASTGGTTTHTSRPTQGGSGHRPATMQPKPAPAATAAPIDGSATPPPGSSTAPAEVTREPASEAVVGTRATSRGATSDATTAQLLASLLVALAAGAVTAEARRRRR